MKILIIDDDPSLRDIYTQEFTRQKFEIVTATNGQEGINSIRESMPDIILLDLIMPEKSGFEVLDMAKADPITKDIPILVLTNIMADFEDLIKHGAADCLLKVDQTPGDIAEKVHKILVAKGKLPADAVPEKKENEEIDLTKPTQ